MIAMMPCPWCSAPFTPRARGAKQRFCSAACRQAFHAAARAWGQAMVDAGLMPVVALKAWAEGRERTAPGKPCTARPTRSNGRAGRRHGPQGESASPVPCGASAGTGAVE